MFSVAASDLMPAGMYLCNGTTLLPLGNAMLCGPELRSHHG